MEFPLKPRVVAKKLHPDAKIPKRNNPTDAGLDLCSIEEVTIYPVGWQSPEPESGENFYPNTYPTRAKIKTGLAFAIPDGYGMFIWDRSGLSTKEGLHRLAGVLDSSYRGELLVALVNLGSNPYTIKVGDKIAQGIICPIALSEVEEVQELDSTDRGDKGFGSSGR